MRNDAECVRSNEINDETKPKFDCAIFALLLLSFCCEVVEWNEGLSSKDRSL